MKIVSDSIYDEVMDSYTVLAEGKLNSDTYVLLRANTYDVEYFKDLDIDIVIGKQSHFGNDDDDCFDEDVMEIPSTKVLPGGVFDCPELLTTKKIRHSAPFEAFIEVLTTKLGIAPYTEAFVEVCQTFIKAVKETEVFNDIPDSPDNL